MADWRAFVGGVQQGAQLGERARQRKGRELYGQTIAGGNQSYSGAIPMPGEEGAAPGGGQQMQYEGPSIQADLDSLAEAYALGGIDDDTFHTGVQNVGMRSYSNVKKAWDAYNNAPDSASKQQALQEIMYSIPGGGMNYVVDMGDGTFSTVPHDEDGQPIEGAQGLMLNDDLVNSMVREATADPDNWFKFVGMSTMDRADLKHKQAQTAGAEGKERRAEEMHPLELASEQALAGQRQAAAANSRARASAAGTAGGAGGAGGNMKMKDELNWLRQMEASETQNLSDSMGMNINTVGAQEEYDNRLNEIRKRYSLARQFRMGGMPVDAALHAAETGQEPGAGAGRTAGSKVGGPAPGAVVNGFRFKGGDPNDQTSWEPAE